MNREKGSRILREAKQQMAAWAGSIGNAWLRLDRSWRVGLAAVLGGRLGLGLLAWWI